MLSVLRCAGALTLLLSLGSVAQAQAQEVTLSVAISMKEAVEDLGRRFTGARPGVVLRYNFGSSGELQKQIEAGAPIDLFISAAQRQMDELERQQLIVAASRRAFARNVLTVIKPADSRIDLTKPADLLDARVLKVVIGNPKTVPAGQYAEESLRALGLWERLQPEARLRRERPAGARLCRARRGGRGVRVHHGCDGARHPGPGDVPARGGHLPARGLPRRGRGRGEAGGAGRGVSGAPGEPRWPGGTGEVRVPAAAGRRSVTPETWSAVTLSVQVATLATAANAGLGLPLAWLLAKRRFRGHAVVDVLVTLPLVLLPTVTGYYLIVLLGRRGWLGAPLFAWTGWTVAFTWVAAVVAATVMALPLLVRAARAAFESVDPALERAARTLGRSAWRVALEVTMPLARNGSSRGWSWPSRGPWASSGPP